MEQIVGWGLLGLFNLLYFGTAVYGIHDMFMGKMDSGDEEDLPRCPVTGQVAGKQKGGRRSSYE